MISESSARISSRWVAAFDLVQFEAEQGAFSVGEVEKIDLAGQVAERATSSDWRALGKSCFSRSCQVAGRFPVQVRSFGKVHGQRDLFG